MKPLLEEIQRPTTKSWRLAIVIHRNKLENEWDAIRRAIESRVRRRVEVIPIAADRAITWCQNKEVLKFLMEEINLYFN